MGRRDERGKLNLAAVLLRRGGFVILPLVIAFSLAGCVDDDTGRQFANEPRPTSGLPTSIPTWPVPTPRLATPQASPLSAEQLLQTRGATERFYFKSNGELWTMAPLSDRVDLVFEPPAGTTLRALASSPSGDRVAAVLVRTEDEAEVADLNVLSMAGDELYRYDHIEALAPDEAAEVVALDWAPQGEKLLVALSPGGLVSVPLTGESEPKLIVSGGIATRPDQAAWSPTGEEIGFLAEAESSQASLYIAGAAATPTDPRALLPDDESIHTILDWAWLPDGRSLLFSGERGLTSTADLWRIKSDGTDRELVASAGSVAPVARIVGAQPSRDGRAVAYVVVVPGEDRAAFDSLWVRDLATNHGFRIDVPPEMAVTDVWWTDAGLMFRAVPSDRFTGEYIDGPFALYRVDDDSTASLMFEATGDAQATPAASPQPSAPD